MKKLLFAALACVLMFGIVACDNVTTQAPTTLAPTTLAPTTLAPTTQAPTTLLPTTIAPTTLAPTTIVTTVDLAPTISGFDDVTVDRKSTPINLMTGITATDPEDGTITSNVVVSGEVNYDEVGSYPITLTVLDSAGNEVIETFTVHVVIGANELVVLSDIAEIDLSEELNLITTGPNGSSIAWTTSHPDVITKKGFVIRPGLGREAITVTLTARVRYGTFTEYVPFEIVVEPYGPVSEVTRVVLLPFEGTSEEYVVEDATDVPVFFVDSGSVPYIDVITFLNLIDGAIESDLINFIPVGSDGLRIEYEVEYEDFDGSIKTESFWAYLDFTENTFTVSSFSFFENYIASTSSDYGEGLTYIDADYVDGSEVTIPLGYYNFDMLIHEEVGEDTYYLMPFHVANLLFAGNIYYDVYYNGDKLWGIDTFGLSGGDEDDLALQQVVRTSSLNSEDAPEDVRWASYNFLALALDYFYGLRGRYNYESMYSFIATYAEDMMTGSDATFYQRIFNIANALDDLHTWHTFPGVYEAPYEIVLSISDLGSKSAAFYNNLWAMQDLLTAKFGSYSDLPPYRLIDDGKTAIIYLTGFTIDTPDEFKGILDQLDSSVQNVVIDLSYNTGGNLGAVLRIFGYMTEEPIVYHSQNPADGAKVTYYIESSYDAYDYNWYVMTSGVTFSAANLFASMAKEMGIAPTIGKNSSGGASSIGAIFTPDGTCLFISTNNVLSTRTGDQESGYEYLSIENGIKVDYMISTVTNDYLVIATINKHQAES